MTERPNDAPGDDLDATSSEPATEPPPDEAPAEVAEEARDLTDAELSAATEDAHFDVEEAGEAGAGEEPTAEEAQQEAEEEAAAREATAAAAAATPLGARARAEQARALARQRAEDARGGREPRATRTPFPIDPSLRIKDPTSAVFVAGTILVFLLIFLNAMAFGHGGAFTPTHRPATPQPTLSAAPSGSPGASGSPDASGSPTSGPTSAPTSAPATTAPLQTGESAAP